MLERWQMCASVATVLLLTHCLHAADPPLSDARVATLIGQLGSLQFEEREAATRALETLGAPALRLLHEARRAGNAEVRRRARLLVQAIERRTETDQLLQPTLVTLSYRDALLSKAAADMSRKTGLLVKIEGDAARRITLETGPLSIWEAVARFGQAAAMTELPFGAPPLELSHYEYDRRVVDLGEISGEVAERLANILVFKDGASPPLAHVQQGALRLRALPLGNAPTSMWRRGSETRLSLEVRLEPRLRLQAVLALKIDRAVDDLGQQLTQSADEIAGAGALAGGPGDEILLAWDGESTLPTRLPGASGQVPFRLRPAKQPSALLKEVHGILAIQVLTPEEPLLSMDGIQTVGRVAQGRDGSAVKVTGVQREQATGSVKIRIDLVPPARELYFIGLPARILLTKDRWRGRGLPVPSPVAPGQLTLLDDQGREVPLVGTPIPALGSGGTAWDFTLATQSRPGQGEPDRLVFTGQRCVTMEVPFILKDVPLGRPPEQKQNPH